MQLIIMPEEYKYIFDDSGKFTRIRIPLKEGEKSYGSIVIQKMDLK